MKGKKLLAGTLSAAMVLSTMSFTALAEGVNNTENNIQLMNNVGALNGITMGFFEADDKMFDEGKKAEGFSLTLHNIPTGTTAIAVEVWHGETKLSTTTYQKSDDLGGTTSVRIVVAGDADISSSWSTTLAETDWYGKTPNTVKVTIGENTKTIPILYANFAGEDKYQRMEISKKKVAKIGDEIYSIEKALKVATANDTITLIDDATPKLTDKEGVAYVLTTAAAINLNGHVLTLNQGNVKLKKDFTFYGKEANAPTDAEKGKIVIAYNLGSKTYNGSFWLTGENVKVTFNDVAIDANNLRDTYLLECWASGTSAEFNNCDITAISTNDSASVSALLCCNATGTSIVINNTDIDFENIDGHLVFNSDVTVKGNSEINASNVASGLCAFAADKTIKIEDTAVVNITNITGTHDWNPENAGIVLGENTIYTKADTATVNTSVYRTPATSNIANDEIKLSFDDVTVNAGEKVYDLYVEAASDKTINRLTTANLTFTLTNDVDNTTPISYEVFGTDKVTVQPDNADSNKYLFYFNGLTAPSGTGVKVKVGQVKFSGYGKFSFKATAGEAHATTIDGENVVTDFVTGTQLTGQGKLNISTELTDVEITIPTKKLTINIDFPNAVTDNAKEYQDMKVTVVGGTVNEEYKLGNGGVAMVDGKYVITTKLPENTPYNVEVSGAGYRTARCSVTMNNDKTLNFWNNVKDTATNVEVGNDTSAKTTTFLAGELVNDGKINIYDLSAVVSYFGANNLVDEHPEYAKYDLNRDGKIDSKDIAYVLVSWGK